MQEIRTSGSMSGDGKRSVAAWPKLPRPSSTPPTRKRLAARIDSANWGEADSNAAARQCKLLTLLGLYRIAAIALHSYCAAPSPTTTNGAHRAG